MPSQYLRIGDWILRVRPPEDGNFTGIAFLIHGWQGDENVMWIFADSLPKSLLLAAPRALYPADQGGYTWVRDAAGEFSTLADFNPARHALESLAEELGHRFDLQGAARHLVGFSQGAALAFAWAAAYPDSVRTIAGLAGFLPEDIENSFTEKGLAGIRVYMGHGSRDRVVPIGMAESGAEVLREAGADVELCTDDVGHKLGSECMRGLERFYRSP